MLTKLDWLHRFRRRFSTLRSWTGDLGRPTLQTPGFDSRHIHYAHYSSQVDVQLGAIRRLASSYYPDLFKQALHALDYFDNQAARMNVIVQCLTDLPAGSLGADIGVAYGYLALLLRDYYGFHLVGVDHPLAIPQFGQFALTCGLEILPWSIGEELTAPLAPNSQDFIIFAEVLEHLNWSPALALRHLVAMLRPGGRLILTTPNAGRYDNIWRLSRGLNTVAPFPDDLPLGLAATNHVEHIREYTIPEVTRLLVNADLNIDAIWMCNSQRVHRLPEAYLEETMCIVASRPKTNRNVGADR